MSLTVQDVEQATRRDDLVPGYTAWIRAFAGTGEMPDTTAVNRAILARWSPAGLIYIKKKAWRAAGSRA